MALHARALRQRRRGAIALSAVVAHPGGWNRIQLPVDDLDGQVERLRAAGAGFRNQVVEGRGGRQILLDDPSGDPIELFEPADVSAPPSRG